jgi:hypothetical protein
MLATISAARMPDLIAGIMLMPCSLLMDCFQNVCVPANVQSRARFQQIRPN